MNTSRRLLGAIVVAVVATVALLAWAAEGGPKEQKVTLDQVPPAVKATILQESQGGKVEDIAREAEDGKTIYEADVIKDGKEIELRVAEDGKLITRKLEGEAKEEGEKGKEEKHDAKAAKVKTALAQAKVALPQALEIAQKQVPGGSLLEIELKMRDKGPVYSIALLDGKQKKEVQLDAVAGTVLKVEAEEAEDEGDVKELAEAAKAVAAARITLEQAIKTATKETDGGQVCEAELVLRDGKPCFKIALLVKDERMKAAIDAVSGKVIKIERAKEKGEKTEAMKEAEECVEGAKALAQAKVTMAQAIETALKEGKGAKPFMAELEMEEGKTIYDVELLDGDKGPEMEIDAINGKVLKIESVEEQAKEDEKEGNQNSKEEQEEAREKAAAAKAMPQAKVTLAEAVETAVKQVSGGKAYAAVFKPEGGKPRYEIQVVAGDKCMEVAIDGVSREVLEVEPKGSTSAKASAKEGGWRDSFPVDKADLVPTGKNPYFSLEPGHQMVYKGGGKVTLTISVLDETKVVDGVTTRIVEEREEKNGKPLEVSRNYFAIDKKTNDVYYFGEDVDEYKGDEVSHGGSWLAGEKGAKFGLMMPAKPKVGDRFYQEMAPKEAMDRAEIVGLEEDLDAPAGRFKCVHVKETSAIEKGVSHKWYAPGVGLIKDDEFVLEKLTAPKP